LQLERSLARYRRAVIVLAILLLLSVAANVVLFFMDTKPMTAQRNVHSTRRK